MVTRRCVHCETEVEGLDEALVSCPVCGLDPDASSVGFDDAPAFFLSGDPFAPELAPAPVRVTSR